MAWPCVGHLIHTVVLSFFKKKLCFSCEIIPLSGCGLMNKTNQQTIVIKRSMQRCTECWFDLLGLCSGFTDMIKLGFGYTRDAVKFILCLFAPSNINNTFTAIRAMSLRDLVVGFFRLHFNVAYMLLMFLFTIFWSVPWLPRRFCFNYTKK